MSITALEFDITDQLRDTKQTNDRKDLVQLLEVDFNVLKLLPGFDLNEIRIGFYSAKYFGRTAQIVDQIEDENQIVTMQIFQKTNGATICGTKNVENLIKICSGRFKNIEKAKKLFNEYKKLKEWLNISLVSGKFENYKILSDQIVEILARLDSLWEMGGDKLEIETLVQDGEKVDAFQPVMKIKGPYKYFAVLESVYLGILAQATKIATNTKKCVSVANGKPVLFFADRFDLFENQPLAGFASRIGGATGVATDANGVFEGIEGIGTMPHALIASFNGNTGEATLEFAKKFPKVPTISLVDFENNCTKTSVEVGEYLKENGIELYGVRLDTSGSMVDEGLLFQQGFLEDKLKSKGFENFETLAQQIKVEYIENKTQNNVVNNSLFGENSLKILKDLGITGVCPELVNIVRQKLDKKGFGKVKIFVSGGFNAEKIELFERLGVEVDGYGIGSSLLTPRYVTDNGDFTADIVSLNGNPTGKVGRKEF